MDFWCSDLASVKKCYQCSLSQTTLSNGRSPSVKFKCKQTQLGPMAKNVFVSVALIICLRKSIKFAIGQLLKSILWYLSNTTTFYSKYCLQLTGEILRQLSIFWRFSWTYFRRTLFRPQNKVDIFSTSNKMGHIFDN